jgi:hypothetical protein
LCKVDEGLYKINLLKFFYIIEIALSRGAVKKRGLSFEEGIEEFCNENIILYK